MFIYIALTTIVTLGEFILLVALVCVKESSSYPIYKNP